MNFTITSAQILAFCAFVTTLWGVWKIVKEIKKDVKESQKDLQKAEKEVKKRGGKKNVV